MKKYLIYLVLLASWAFLTVIYVYGSSNITVNTSNLDQNSLTKKTVSEFLKGEKIEGRFNASENYLGQFSVRFYNYDRINKDEVAFRIKEHGQDWFYQNTYKTDQFQPHQLFPFGFQTIVDSKGRLYEFEIESLAGKEDDSVTLSGTEPIATATYQYPKKLLLTSPQVLKDFLVGKISNTNFDVNFVFSVIEYLITTVLLLTLIYLGITSFTFKNIRRLPVSSICLFFGIGLILFSAILYYMSALKISEITTVTGFFIVLLGTITKTIKDL